MVTVAPSTVAPVPVTWAESPFSFIVALYEADEQADIRHSAPASVSAEKIAIILVFFNVTTFFYSISRSSARQRLIFKLPLRQRSSSRKALLSASFFMSIS